jgi:glycosyltransferase involved in cell wall biosynthesis
MKISVFIYGLTGGGATRRVVTLAEGWAEKGHEVQLVVVNPKGPLYDRVKRGPLKLVPLRFGPWEPLVRLLPRRKQIFWSRFPLAVYLKKETPDLFLSAANHVHLTALVAKIRSKVSLPFVLRLSNHVRASLLRSRGFKAFKNRLKLRTIKRLYPEADFIVAVSQGILEDLLALIPFQGAHGGGL